MLRFGGCHLSYVTNHEVPVLSAPVMVWFWRQYVGPNQIAAGDDPRCSPVRGQLVGLAPACVFTANADPLCDDGEEYVAALRAAGNDVLHVAAAGSHVGALIFDQPAVQRAMQFARAKMGLPPRPLAQARL